MSINSSLELFPLPELFRLIDSKKKSGRLMIQIPPTATEDNKRKIYYIWFREGRLVAISDRLNYRGLISLIEDRGWLSTLVSSKLRTMCPPQMPLGVYLVKMKLLTPERLKLIVQIQLHQVYHLFGLTSGWFRFDEPSELRDRLMTIPWLEMTGNSIRATAVTMYALRLIKNWNSLSLELPNPDYALKRLVEQPHLRLMASERQVWLLANGSTSLRIMAEQLNLSIKEVQVIALRLIMVGLTDEVLLASGYPQLVEQNSLASLVSFNLATRTSKKSLEEHLIKSVDRSLFSNVLNFIRDQF